MIWYDAHGDLNIPEESPSGNVHGMPLRVLAGEGDEELVQLGGFAPKVKPENIVLIGMRDLDEGEKQYIKKHHIQTYTMADIDRYGIQHVIEETINYLKDKTDGIHLSLDVDGLGSSRNTRNRHSSTWWVNLSRKSLCFRIITRISDDYLYGCCGSKSVN